MSFNPDTFLAEPPAGSPTAFDPDAYLGTDSSPKIGNNWSQLYNGLDGMDQRIGPEQRQVFQKLDAVSGNPKQGRAQAINQAYFQDQHPDITHANLELNWPTIRQAYAKQEFGMMADKVDDVSLYGAIQKRFTDKAHEEYLQDNQIKAIPSKGGGDKTGVLGLAWAWDHALGDDTGMRALKVQKFWEGINKPAWELPRAPDNLPDIPAYGMQNPALAGAVYNGLAPLFESAVATPLGIATLGAGAPLHEAAKAYPLAKAALLSMSGAFTGLMGYGTVQSAKGLPAVFNDPNATFQDKVTKATELVANAGATLLGVLGTAFSAFSGKDSVRIAKSMDGQTPAEGAQTLRTEAAKLETPEQQKPVLDAAKKLDKLAPIQPPEGQTAPNAAQPAPEQPNIVQPLDNGGFVVTDAHGRLIDYAETAEEAKALAEGKKVEPEQQIAPAELLSPETEEGFPATYNLTEDIPGHPKGSTVSADTLEKAGFKLPEAPEATDTPTDAETTGIAHRVSEERGTAAERGKGISPEDSVDRGRELLAEGGDPEAAVKQHAATGSISADAMALVRAQAEKLGKAARDAEAEFGADSPQYKAAAKADAEWIKQIKPMQTEWHKIGQAQQGETEIDTGTFHGLRRAYQESSGKDFTAKQAEQAKEVAGKVSEATKAAEDAKKRLIKAALGDEAAKPRAARPSREISARAKEARARIAQRLENIFTKHAMEGEDNGGFLSKENLDDLAIVASEYIAKGASQLAALTDHMVKEFGEAIRPHMEDIFAKGKEEKARVEDEQVKAKFDAKKAEIEGRIEELKKKIENKDLSAKPESASRPSVEEIEKLKQQRDALNEKLAGMREEAAREQEAAEAVASNAETIAAHTAGEDWTPEQAKALWQDAKENYLDKGVEDFDDIRHGLANDHGLPVDDVTKGLATPKGVREITDEMYAKAAARRRTINLARDFVANAKYPGYQKFFRAVPGAFFNMATFGHGTVWSVTHSGVNWFNPEAIAGHFKALGQSFKLMVDSGYHERMMQDLVRDSNFIKAKRAGLANDPFKYTDDYQNAGVVKIFKQMGLMGNRGFDGLKLFRQFRFNQEWEKLPSSLQNPEMAKLVADAINKSTGITRQSNLPSWTNMVFFAPKMEMSRWAFIFGDPAKAAKTLILDHGTATVEEHAAAMSQVKQKAIIAGTYFAALAVNQGLLSATNSDQSINFTDPHKSDWLSFKAGEHKIGIISPMIGSVRFLSNLFHTAFEQRNKYEQKDSRFSEATSLAGDYLRGKLSPFAKVVTDSLAQKDFRGNTMPWSDDHISLRSQSYGIHQYTYAEYIAKNLTPIPVQEAMTDAWKAKGMTDGQAEQILHAVILGAVAGTLGAHVAEDHTTKPQALSAPR